MVAHLPESKVFSELYFLVTMNRTDCNPENILLEGKETPKIRDGSFWDLKSLKSNLPLPFFQSSPKDLNPLYLAPFF